jgi:hypothetical protein
MTKKKWENGCRFHAGAAELSIEGRGVKFVVCRTCGATGPYGNSENQSIRRWYDNITDELDNLDLEPKGGDFSGDKGDSRVSRRKQ